MNAAVPTLRIRSYDAAIEFYVDGLGFRVDWEWRHEPGLPVFMQLSRGTLRLYLTQHEEDCALPGLVYLYVPDVDAWQVEMLTRGVVAEGAPVDEPWGNRQMMLRDPDGNGVCVCQVLASSR